MKMFKYGVFFTVLVTSFSLFGGDFFSFDSLFPVFWYEKAVRATMCAMHDVTMLNNGEISDNQRDLLCTCAMGYASFALFCITQIKQDQNKRCIEEDRRYFSRLLHRLDTAVDAVLHTQSIKDQIFCLKDIICVMQEQLCSMEGLLYSEADVYSEGAATNFCCENTFACEGIIIKKTDACPN